VRSRSGQLMVVLLVAGGSILLPLNSFAADSGDVRTRAEQSFSQLQQHSELGGSSNAPGVLRRTGEARNSYSSDQYLVGKGQGDLAKGQIICQRVSELSARTDLAKQIRILVKEHMVDRVRERMGGAAEQDVEVTREEIVQEYLQGVKIVDRQIDEGSKTCSATAVMLKNQVQPKPAPDHLDPTPIVIR
jgi:hypothetical protein